MDETISRNKRASAANDPVPLLAACCLVVLAGLIAYSNSFSGPFVFDDAYVTTGNPTIRHLGTNLDVLFPPKDLPVGGRPILNLSYVLNYAVSGFDVWSYHGFNLLIHLLAGLTLLGILRRTFRQPVLRERFGHDALPLAAAIALLWVVHPVQTEAVTYISQRAESMMSLFYLLTLYGFIRATEPGASKKLWRGISLGACLCGMATKEVMATAPLVVLLYDRTFVAGTFREAWRQRWRCYAALAATWILLANSLPSVGQRSVGLEQGVTPWHYALTECAALIHYLVLVVWPHPLVIDYGDRMVTNPLEVAPQAVVLLALLAATAWALMRKPVLGFAGACFFLILAPTSSFIPVALSPEAEHRLYLPLAALLGLAMPALYLVAGRKSFVLAGILAFVLSALTLLRNEDYRTAVDLWRQTLDAVPDNARGHNNYGEFLIANGQPEDAIPELARSLQLNPDNPQAHNNWGYALAELGQVDAAVAQYQEAIKLQANYEQPHNNYGLLLFGLRRYPEAIAQFQEALRINPLCAEAANNWGNVLLQTGDFEGAIAHYQQAAKLNPDWADVHTNWGTALEAEGRYAEARAQFGETLRADPNSAAAQAKLAQLDAQGK